VAVQVRYMGASAKGNVYLLAVGVTRYDDPAITGLKYSNRDVEGLVAAFKAQEGKRYSRVNAVSLAEGALAPTTENIRDSLAFLQKAGTQDTIVLFISGRADGNRDGRVNLMELEDYVKKTVAERKPGQNPYLWTKGEYKDLVLTE
jgi:hypothetical protein